MFKVIVASMMGLAIILSTGPAPAGVCSLEISPLTLEIQLEPGRAHTDTIRITNLSEEPERIHAYCQDWTLKPDGVVVFFAAGKLPGSASPYLQLTPSEFELQPGETRQVRYTIRLPAEVTSEVRTAVIFEAAAREVRVPNAPSRLVPRLGTILYLQPGPRPPTRARAEAFEIDRSGGLLTVGNLGSAHLRFRGHIEVRDERGALVRRHDLNPFVVLPAPFNRHISGLDSNLLADLPAGAYQVTALLDYGGDALLGARLEVNLGPEPPVEIAGES
jgi:P pilus assembly chaperone PapD